MLVINDCIQTNRFPQSLLKSKIIFEICIIFSNQLTTNDYLKKLNISFFLMTGKSGYNKTKS